MKYKLLALILTVTVVSWTQTATQSTPSTPQQSTAPDKAKCACCEKLASADAKDAHACGARHGDHQADAKEMASCCSGKDGVACCGGKDAKSCMKAGRDKCCSDCDKSKTAKACCGSDCQKQCKGGKCCGAKKVETAESDCCDRNLSSQIDSSQNFAGLGK